MEINIKIKVFRHKYWNTGLNSFDLFTYIWYWFSSWYQNSDHLKHCIFYHETEQSVFNTSFVLKTFGYNWRVMWLLVLAGVEDKWVYTYIHAHVLVCGGGMQVCMFIILTDTHTHIRDALLCMSRIKYVPIDSWVIWYIFGSLHLCGPLPMLKSTTTMIITSFPTITIDDGELSTSISWSKIMLKINSDEF